MTRFARSAWVIARRDYVATVWTRAFLLFLITPLLPFLFVAISSAIDNRDVRDGPPPLVVRADPADLRLLAQARTRLTARLGADWLPPLTTVPQPDAAVLSSGLAEPLLSGSRDALSALKGKVGLLVDTARALRGGEAIPARLSLRVVADPLADAGKPRRELAQGAQAGMFFLCAILAGMLISNLVEEKSSKVIEVLAAAVPVDAVFGGKLAGMLAVSMTGLALWGTAGAIAAAAFLPHHALPVPAIGWPAFVLLVGLYWMLLYLLLGALYLGIGAQAGSVREVQTLSLPLTIGQLLFFGLAQAAAKRPDGALGLIAVALPWSSPFAMVAQAAERPAWWPHVLAIAWQLLWLAIVVRIGARLFRRNVLRSGSTLRNGGLLAYMGLGRRRA